MPADRRPAETVPLGSRDRPPASNRRQFWISSRKAMTHLVGKGSIGRYGLIGLSGVAADFGVFWLLVEVGLIPLLATVVGAFVGMVNNYGWNSLANFEVPVTAKRGLRFVSVGTVGLIAAAWLLHFFMSAGLSAIHAKLSSIPVIVIAQYLAHRYWTFQD